MKSRGKEAKDETVVVRVSKAAVRSLDKLAKVIGGNRSEALRRLIPDLSRAGKGARR